MRLKRYFLCAVATAMAFVGCNKNEQPIADIIVSVTPESLSLEEAVQEKTVQLTATRAWKAVITYEGDAQDWLTVQPANGSASAKPQTVTIIAKANTGRERKASVKFTIGLDDATLPVVQAGPGGSADPVYFNDFDKTDAQKSGDAWPSAGDTDCWKNQKGTGAADVTYVTAGTKNIRCNNNSTGSGHNNYFFSNNTVLAVKNIALVEGQTNYVLSFYGLRNVFDAPAGGSVFDHSQFKVCVSNDGAKWVELTYAFEGGDPDNTWAQAKSTFTVPAGTKTLHIGFPFPGEASTYRLDDVKLDVADAAGTAVDFSAGKAMPEFNGGTDPIDPVYPGTPEGDGTEANPYNATAAYNAAKALEADKVTEQFYYVKGFIKNIAGVDTGSYGNANFYIVNSKDGNTEQFYCFQVMYLNGEKFTSADQIKVGDEVVVYAQLVNYKGNTPETNGKGSGRIVKHNGKGEGAQQELTTTEVAKVLAAAQNTKITFNDAVVVAASTKGLVLTDAKGEQFVYAFNEKGNTIAAGKKVNVVCTRDEYNSMPELKVISAEETGTAAVKHPAVTDISSKLDSYTSTKIEYVSITGTLSIASSKYYNVAVAGQTVQGSIESPVQDLNSLIGIPVTYIGYRIYNSSSSAGGKFVNIILTEFRQDGNYLNVSPLAITIPAAGGTDKINVTSSVAWTASCDTQGYTIDKTSGNGDDTITVTCPENTSNDAKTVKVTVSTTADVATKSYEVVITQKGQSSGEAITINAVFSEEGVYGIKGTSKAKTTGQETFKVDGYEFVLAGDGTNGCAAYKGYLLFGKKGAYIQMPAIDGYKLKSIVILTGTGASTNVTTTVYATDGTTVASPEQKLSEKNKEFTFELASPVAGAAYRLVVTNAYNAQAQKLVLTYEK